MFLEPIFFTDIRAQRRAQRIQTKMNLTHFGNLVLYLERRGQREGVNYAGLSPPPGSPFFLSDSLFLRDAPSVYVCASRCLVITSVIFTFYVRLGPTSDLCYV